MKVKLVGEVLDVGVNLVAGSASSTCGCASV
jgi:hypothetical protein